MLAAALVAAVGLGTAACAQGGGPRRASERRTSRDSPAGAGGGHTTWVETFVDRSRPTVPRSGAPLPSRTLVTTVYRPVGPGPFPLIVFSHGINGHPDRFTGLLSAWADAGFVVAAPAFPLTNGHAPDPSADVGDVTNQPADVSFVLDQVIALGRRTGSRLHGAIDEGRVGAGGLSLGGITTYVVAYGPTADARVRAVEILDGVRPTDLALDGHVPLLIAHSDADPTIAYASARDAFDAARPPVWLLTLHGAPHSAQWEDDPTPYDRVAVAVTRDFWQATLRQDAAAAARLVGDATVEGLSSIEVKQPPG